MKLVLIVDDQADIRRLLTLTLAHQYSIIQAENATDALKLVRERRPDAVLLDVMMPGPMDGFGLCAEIKKDAALRKTVVFLITARGQEADEEKGRQCGADGYFVKPFSPITLLMKLDDILS